LKQQQILKVKQDLDLKKNPQEDYKIKKMKNYNHYNYLAQVFKYPTENYVEQMNMCGKNLKNDFPKAYESFLRFLNIINKLDKYEVEELFSMTFHIQAICYLDLGYVLYAEDYKRGEFLVQMKKEQEKVNNDLGVELADNLPNALTLIPLLEDDKFREELVVRMYIPAIKSMLKEFDASRIALKIKVRKKKQKVLLREDMQNRNAYQYAIETLYKVFQADFEVDEYIDKMVKSDPLSSFLPNCEGSCATSAPSTKKAIIIEDL
jgi:nitrate reductase assembly molybdenum cofactor insertion protein NarJ